MNTRRSMLPYKLVPMMRVWPGLAIGGLLVGIGFAACDSPTGPDHGAVRRVSLEQMVTDEASVDDTIRRYSFAPTDNGWYGVYFQLLEGRGYLAIRDSTAFNLLAYVLLTPRSGDLRAEAAGPFQLTGGHTYIVDFYPVPRGASMRYRFQPHRINLEPEHQLPVTYDIGDTISTERIDDILDIDDFRVHGVAGQEINVAIKATGTPGTEGITVTVFDPSDFFYTYTFTSAGQPGSVTGRFSLPTTGTYRISVQGVSGALGRYAGPYQMWTYPINRAPERRLAAVNPGVEISGEDLAPTGDVDEFAFSAPTNSAYNVFLQSNRSALVRLQVFDGSGNYLALVDAAPGDTGLFNRATGRFPRPTGGPVTLRVFGESDHSVSDTGAYRLYVYQIDPLPEHRGAAIAPGDTVSGESIDKPGDVDEFTFSGSAGEELNLAFQSLPTSNTFRVDVMSPGNLSIAYAETFFPDTTLYQTITGTFTLPSTGTYRIRVASNDSRFGYDIGPYRFFLYRINRQPESLPATLALGDSLAGESIEVAGDIDEFHVTVPDSTGANLVVELTSPPQGFHVINAEIIDSATGQVKGAASIGTAGERSSSGRLRLGPGTHIVRISTGYYNSTLRGPYRVWLYGFSWGPESVSDTFAIGDTVSGEAIEPWGDADVFHFYGVRGQHVNLKFQGLNPAAGLNGLVASIRQQGQIFGPNVFSQLSAPSLESFQSMRLDLPATGWYDLGIAGAGNLIDERGAYRFALVVEDSLPEHVGTSLVPGDSVGNEPIDTPGDWDQFIVTATPGQELGLVFDGKDGTIDPFPFVRALDPATNDSLAGTVGQSERFVGPFTVPASGQVKVAVFEPVGFFRSCADATCGGAFRFTGPYGLQIVPVNRAPELAPAAYTVGDTVRGEAIATSGDLDEFTSTGTPGAPLGVFFRMTAPPGGQPYGLTIEIIDPVTGDTLAGRGTQTFGQQFWQVGSFSIPAGGNFIVRVRGTGTFGEQLTTGPYEFFIQP